MSELQPGPSLFLLFGEQVKRESTAKNIGFGETFSFRQSFETIVDLIGEADFEARGGQ